MKISEALSHKPIVIDHRGNLGNLQKKRTVENTTHSLWNTYADAIELNVCLTQNTINLEDLLPIPKDKKLFIEIKLPKSSSPDKNYINKVTRKLVDFIRDNKLAEKVIVICSSGEVLDRIKTLNPNIKTALNVFCGEGKSPKKISSLRRDFGFDSLLLPFSQVKKYAIDSCHIEGIDVYPWVYRENPLAEIRKATRLIEMGVDGIITNQVEILRRIIDEST